MPSQSDLLFSQLLVQSELITDTQAATCLVLIRKSETDGRPEALGDVIFEQGILEEKPLRNAFNLMTRFPYEQRKIGERIGPYVTVRQLGRGGMGPCYEAADTRRSQETVALKTLPKMMAANHDFRERFFRAVIKGMQLRHENVVRTIEADADGEVCYVAHEMVPGQALGAVLDHLPMLEENQARELVVQAALGLQHLEKHGTTHGNLKPNNLILTHTGLVKLTDCTLAPFSGWGEVLVQPTGSWGRPYYAAPEHGQPGASIDIRSDIYSLGVIFYEMLTGGVPFSGGIPILDLQRRFSESWPDIRSKNPSISDEALAIIDRMTALSPDGRYSTIDELLGELEASLGSATPIGVQEPKTEEERGDAEWADTRGFDSVGAETEGVRATEAKPDVVEDFYKEAKAAEGASVKEESKPTARKHLDGSQELMALLEEAEKIAETSPGTKRMLLREPEETGEEGDTDGEAAGAESRDGVDDRVAPPDGDPAPAGTGESEPSEKEAGLSPLVIAVASGALTFAVVLIILYLLDIL